MKIIKPLFIVAFFAVIAIQDIAFNATEGAVSEIDNMVLPGNPFLGHDAENIGSAIEEYLSDRIGFRDKQILAYTIANDRLFQEMVHPSYEYGRDGYVFFRATNNSEYGEYHESFVNLVNVLQDYCDNRDIPFVFVLDPYKNSIYKDELRQGYNYDDQWVVRFFDELGKRDIKYVDNLATMKGLRENGIDTFNVKYNAGHWNDTGAFYGMNALLRHLSDRGVQVHINNIEEYRIDQKLNTTLAVSEFPIKEYEPIYSIKKEGIIHDLTPEYEKEIIRDEEYQAFGYYINDDRVREGSSRALVFQGSYLNGMGYKFLQNAFGEYIYIHDYQNILNFEYYMNIFKPDCVIFEVAQNAFSDGYFDSEKMKTIDLNLPIGKFDHYKTDCIEAELKTTIGRHLTTVSLEGVEGYYDYGYMISEGREFDLIKETDESGNIRFFISVENDDFNEGSEFYLIDNDAQIRYSVTMTK